VYKTSPQVRLIKALNPEKDKIKILTFEGVRADESARRGGYARIADEAKHIVQTNAEVIKYWNLSEVYLYLYKINIRDKEGKLIINKGYRYGLERVGCSICPFGSPWSELIIRQALPEHTNQYINIIEEYAKNLGIEDIQEYIAKGNWKKRAGGKGIYSNTHIFLLKESSSITAVIKNNNSSIKNRLEWFNVLDGFSYKNSENTIDGEMLIRNNLYKFRIDNNDGNSVIYVNNIKEEDNKIFTKLFNKATYCINCGACETECDSRALKVIPYVRIDRSLCKHCFKCLTFSPHGCILADSLNISMEGNTMKETQKIKINRYFTFGLRDEWLIPFLNNREEWFIKNNLGPDQLKAFIAWLQDAEILRNKSITSNVGERIIEIFKKDNILAFQIIWINLFYNSTIVSWYIKNIKWNSFISEREIKEMLKTYFSDSAERTLSNSVASLFNSFEKNSYISEKLRLGTVEKIGRERYVRKIGSNDIHPMAVLYSLYRYAISKNKYKLTVSELYREGNKDGGPYLIFGIERSALENILRWLQENKEELIRVNLTADLDNINLSEDITDYTKILEYY
ncbi:MAG TPA: hypothetical protein PKW19_08005, partial [Dictyoglomaceae bacterium]|nr:hypothetical protein [Dictyoglomaceae bacterium]